MPTRELAHRVATITANSSNLPHSILNCAHEGLAAPFFAVVFDCFFVVRKSLKIEYGLIPRCAEIAVYPRGDKFSPYGVRARILLAGDQGHVNLDLPPRGGLWNGTLQGAHHGCLRGRGAPLPDAGDVPRKIIEAHRGVAPFLIEPAAHPCGKDTSLSWRHGHVIGTGYSRHVQCDLGFA